MTSCFHGRTHPSHPCNPRLVEEPDKEFFRSFQACLQSAQSECVSAIDFSRDFCFLVNTQWSGSESLDKLSNSRHQSHQLEFFVFLDVQEFHSCGGVCGVLLQMVFKPSSSKLPESRLMWEGHGCKELGQNVVAKGKEKREREPLVDNVILRSLEFYVGLGKPWENQAFSMPKVGKCRTGNQGGWCNERPVGEEPYGARIRCKMCLTEKWTHSVCEKVHCARNVWKCVSQKLDILPTRWCKIDRFWARDSGEPHKRELLMRGARNMKKRNKARCNAF